MTQDTRISTNPNQISKARYVIYLLFFITMIPVILLRDFTPSNELRYLSIADEAIDTGTLFAFTNHGMPYADKPPLYLWLVMLCKVIAGKHLMWLLSLMSLIPALITAEVMSRMAADSIDVKWQGISTLMVVTSGMFLVSAVTLRMDMLMTMFIVLAFYSFWRIFKNADNRALHKWTFPIFLFLALFTKGPYGLLIPLAGTTVFLITTRNIRTFFRYWGLRTWGVLLVLCALWFMAVYFEGGKEYLDNLLFHQTIDRAVNSFHHDRPFYYYAICIWYCLAPWCFMVVGIICTSLRPSLIKSDLLTYSLMISVSGFILLSCVSAKLSIYMLPVIPFMIYAAALRIPDIEDNAMLRVSLGIPALIFALGFPGLLIAKGMPGIPSYIGGGTFITASIVLSISGILSLIMLFGKRDRRHPKEKVYVRRVVYTMGLGMLLTVFTAAWGLKSVNPSIGYASICNTALRVSEAEGIDTFKTWNIRRSDNIDVYLKHPVAALEGETPPPEISDAPYLLIIHKKDLKLFPDHRVATDGDYAVVVCRDESTSSNSTNK